jgi:hypothetical protein
MRYEFSQFFTLLANGRKNLSRPESYKGNRPRQGLAPVSCVINEHITELLTPPRGIQRILK